MEILNATDDGIHVLHLVGNFDTTDGLEVLFGA